MANDATDDPTGEDQESCSTSTSLNNLLRVVDGDYDLDALAMAVVNGNRVTVYLLRKASLRCESNPYHTISYEPKDEDSREAWEEMAAVSGSIVSKSCEGEWSKAEEWRKQNAIQL